MFKLSTSTYLPRCGYARMHVAIRCQSLRAIALQHLTVHHLFSGVRSGGQSGFDQVLLHLLGSHVHDVFDNGKVLEGPSPKMLGALHEDVANMLVEERVGGDKLGDDFLLVERSFSSL